MVGGSTYADQIILKPLQEQMLAKQTHTKKDAKGIIVASSCKVKVQRCLNGSTSNSQGLLIAF